MGVDVPAHRHVERRLEGQEGHGVRGTLNADDAVRAVHTGRPAAGRGAQPAAHTAKQETYADRGWDERTNEQSDLEGSTEAGGRGGDGQRDVGAAHAADAAHAGRCAVAAALGAARAAAPAAPPAPAAPAAPSAPSAPAAYFARRRDAYSAQSPAESQLRCSIEGWYRLFN